jgi:hypothetical protein
MIVRLKISCLPTRAEAAMLDCAVILLLGNSHMGHIVAAPSHSLTKSLHPCLCLLGFFKNDNHPNAWLVSGVELTLRSCLVIWRSSLSILDIKLFIRQMVWNVFSHSVSCLCTPSCPVMHRSFQGWCTLIFLLLLPIILWQSQKKPLPAACHISFPHRA